MTRGGQRERERERDDIEIVDEKNVFNLFMKGIFKF